MFPRCPLDPEFIHHDTAWARTFPLIQADLDKAKNARLARRQRRRDACWEILASGLKTYRQKFIKVDAACLPQNEDINEFEKLREWIDDNEGIPTSADSAYRFLKSMGNELNAWGAQRRASILALNGLNNTGLELATTVFSRSRSNFPSLVLLHEEEVFSWRGPNPKDLPTLDTTAQAAVLSILDILKFDPVTTTKRALDCLKCEFLCLNCPAELPKRQGRPKFHLEPRIPLTWRTAVSHGSSLLYRCIR